MGKLFFSMLSLNMRAALALRGAFLMRIVYVLLNHAAMIATWVFLFKAVPVVYGWTFWHTMLTYGIAWFAWGFTSFFAYGFRTLARTIEFGELDHFLLQPRPVLLMLAANGGEVFGINDMILSVMLIAVAAGHLTISLPLLIFGLVCASVSFISFTLLIGSLAFWLQDMHDWILELQFLMFIFATRPASAFTGWIKFLMFSFLPVGFISFLPVEILRLNDAGLMLAETAGSAALAGSAFFIFRRGLRHYESGNRFGVRV